MSDTPIKHREFDKHFTSAAAVEAEGARIGFTTCKTCGAAILLDPRDTENWPQRHADWHKNHGGFYGGNKTNE